MIDVEGTGEQGEGWRRIAQRKQPALAAAAAVDRGAWGRSRGGVILDGARHRQPDHNQYGDERRAVAAAEVGVGAAGSREDRSRGGEHPGDGEHPEPGHSPCEDEMRREQQG